MSGTPSTLRPRARHGDGAARRRTGLVVRLGALCLVAIFAVAVMVSGLDRLAGSSPAAAARLGRPFGARSLIVTAQQAIERQDYKQALSTAQAAVRAAPVEPESTALLGASLLGVGDDAGAQRAFLVAGRLGWRTPLTQFYWMDQALAVEDYRVAVLRLDALLRQNPELVGNASLLGAFENDGPAQSQFVEFLKTEPNWLGAYVHDFGSLDAAAIARRGRVLQALGTRGHPLGCTRIGQLATALFGSGAQAEANSLWQAHCPEQAKSLVGDGSFRYLEVHEAGSPFEWSIIGNSDVSLSTVDGPVPGTHRLVVATTAPFARRIASRAVLLNPGRYTVSWKTDKGTVGTGVVAALSCAPNVDTWSRDVAAMGGGREGMTFDIGNECIARYLSLGILSGSGTVQIGDIDLKRVG